MANRTTSVPEPPSTGASEGSGFDTTEARTQWKVVLRRFARHRLAMVSLAVFVLMLLFAWIGQAIWPYTAADNNLGRYLPPSLEHPFGTGQIGDDVLAKVLRGTDFSLRIALVVAVLNTLIGVVIGALAGYFRGWVDSLLSRFVDLILILPPIVVVAVLARATYDLEEIGQGGGQSNWFMVALILGCFQWPSIARTIRGMVLSLREKEFVEAARALGGGPMRIVFKHVLPNTVDVIIVNATIAIAQAVLIEAALSFIGLGVQYPDSSLGLLISENQNELQVHPWLFWFPFLFIVLISLSVNFVGDGLRDAFDPRQKRVRA